MKKAFTLVELALVMAILALLAHLAVRSLGEADSTRRQRLYDAQRLELIDAAKAFLADNGRLPRLLPSADGSGRLTLRELYERPDDLAVYAVRLAGPGGRVALPCGWNGPYVKLGAGKSTLRDPWGNEWAQPDETGVDRLTALTNDFPKATSSISVELAFIDGDGVKSEADLSPNAAGTVNVRWYAPNGGTITGGVLAIERSSGGIAVFDGVPASRCAVQVDSIGFTSAVERVDVPAGGALVEMLVPAR